jgi:CheY-like chemotaxis protein
MKQTKLMVLLADDDKDDCLLFKEALNELSLPVELTIVYNGEQLMHLLNRDEQPHDILFLDLNMPRKNGFDCLGEIRQIEKLNELSVVAISTSYEAEVVNRLYASGAQHFIRKPNDFSQLKNLIENAITLTSKKIPAPIVRENFVAGEA